MALVGPINAKAVPTPEGPLSPQSGPTLLSITNNNICTTVTNVNLRMWTLINTGAAQTQNLTIYNDNTCTTANAVFGPVTLQAGQVIQFFGLQLTALSYKFAGTPTGVVILTYQVSQ